MMRKSSTQSKSSTSRSKAWVRPEHVLILVCVVVNFLDNSLPRRQENDSFAIIRELVQLSQEFSYPQSALPHSSTQRPSNHQMAGGGELVGPRDSAGRLFFSPELLDGKVREAVSRVLSEEREPTTRTQPAGDREAEVRSGRTSMQGDELEIPES